MHSVGGKFRNNEVSGSNKYPQYYSTHWNNELNILIVGLYSSNKSFLMERVEFILQLKGATGLRKSSLNDDEHHVLG